MLPLSGIVCCALPAAAVQSTQERLTRQLPSLKALFCQQELCKCCSCSKIKYTAALPLAAVKQPGQQLQRNWHLLARFAEQTGIIIA
jgi:hypothetical protein